MSNNGNKKKQKITGIPTFTKMRVPFESDQQIRLLLKFTCKWLSTPKSRVSGRFSVRQNVTLEIQVEFMFTSWMDSGSLK